MDIVKECIDVAVITNNLKDMMHFWQTEIGLVHEEVLPVADNVNQYRYNMNGSVFKLNHTPEKLTRSSPSGYRELSITRPGITSPKTLIDPDGNRVNIVPKGHGGISDIGIQLEVRDEMAFDHFYGYVLGLPKVKNNTYRFGNSIISFKKDDTAKRAGDIPGIGFRYITLQVRKADKEHQGILERGGEEGLAPVTLEDVARFSFVRDPDGNWIEISQRKSLTGTLD